MVANGDPGEPSPVASSPVTATCSSSVGFQASVKGSDHIAASRRRSCPFSDIAPLEPVGKDRALGDTWNGAQEENGYQSQTAGCVNHVVTSTFQAIS